MNMLLEARCAHDRRWKQYPAYKDSGVEWLGVVPEGWDVKRLKYCAARINEKVDGRESNLPYTGLEHIESWTGRLTISEEISTSEGQSSRCEPGDVLFGKLRPYLAKVFRAKEHGICTGELLVLRPKDVSQDYLFSYMLARDFISIVDSSTYGAKMPRASWDFIGDLPVLLPSEAEQRAIAAFLDHETGRIDALIVKKERQIGLLQEKRTALISHAVTKGLDPNAPMRDSGVEWLGVVPEGWEIIRVKLLEGNDTSVVQTGPFGAQLHASDYLDDGVPLILIRNVRDLKIDETGIPRVSEEDAERLSMYRLSIGDIVFSRVGSIGRIALCTEREKGWLISGQMLRLRIQNPRLDSKFSTYGFSSESVLTFVELQSVGSTRESINTDILRNMPIPIPPLPEQRAIATFLDRETGHIDILTTKVHESISKLREYRTALISAAVTGKIDVRGDET